MLTYYVYAPLSSRFTTHLEPGLNPSKPQSTATSVRPEEVLPIQREKIEAPSKEITGRIRFDGGRYDGLAKYGSCEMGMQVPVVLYNVNHIFDIAEVTNKVLAAYLKRGGK